MFFWLDYIVIELICFIRINYWMINIEKTRFYHSINMIIWFYGIFRHYHFDDQLNIYEFWFKFYVAKTMTMIILDIIPTFSYKHTIMVLMMAMIVAMASPWYYSRFFLSLSLFPLFFLYGSVCFVNFFDATSSPIRQNILKHFFFFVFTIVVLVRLLNVCLR